MKGTSMTAVAREELKSAQTALATAERKLELSRAATNKARALHEETVQRAFEHEAGERRASVSLTDRIKAAIKGGADPSFDEDTAKNTAARTALEARRQAAERAVADLVEEQREAGEAVAAAREAVGEAISDVLRATAGQIAARWEAVEAEALTLRERLGRTSGTVWRVGMNDSASPRALLENNEALFTEVDRLIENQWVEFASALVCDPEARIEFAAVDAAKAAEREECEDYRTTVAAIAARTRAARLAEARP